MLDVDILTNKVLELVSKLVVHSSTRALLRLERTMHLFGGREGRWTGGGWGREGGRGGRERTMCCVTSLIGMFNSNPMIPQHLNNNLT